MKKRIMLGKSCWLLIFLCFIVSVIIFFICFPLISERHISIVEMVKGLVVSIILAMICFLLNQGLNASIKISGEDIILNAIFKPKKIYNKKDIVISYAIHEPRGRGTYESPCLVLGCWYDNKICYTKRKFVYDNYFLVLLDHKKLKTILSWYNEEINLPPKQELERFHTKEIKRFYGIIEQHNMVVHLEQRHLI